MYSPPPSGYYSYDIMFAHVCTKHAELFSCSSFFFYSYKATTSYVRFCAVMVLSRKNKVRRSAKDSAFIPLYYCTLDCYRPTTVCMFFTKLKHITC